jgi:signal transduction histidine kinase
LPDDINQVVLNLIVNAAHAIADVIEAQGTGKGCITLRTHQELDGIVLSIRDTGSGIPAAIRDRIFDPFFTTKAVGKGTGQGLAMAYDVIVRKHGGTLTFDTVEGEGTTFRVRLPLAGV